MKVVISFEIPEEISGQLDIHELAKELKNSIAQHLAFEKQEWISADWTENDELEDHDLLWWNNHVCAKFDEMIQEIDVKVWGGKDDQQ